VHDRCLHSAKFAPNPLRLVIERVLGGEYPTSGIQHHLVMESGEGLSARSDRTDRVVECR
jgi:hypothetical protein